MPFWADPNAQPKMSFKWWASFGLPGFEISRYCLRSFQKPSFEIGTSEYIWLNDVAYRPGILSWNPIEITITDSENNDDNNAYKLYTILKVAGYQNSNASQPQSAIEKKAASFALGNDMRLTQIDHDNKKIEEWVLVNPFITQINFGQSNYVADEIITISLSIRYDYASYER